MTSQEVISMIELLSAGKGEVNEKNETAELEEWLGDCDSVTVDDIPSIQAEWNEYYDGR